MIQYILDNPATAAAFLSFVATCLAAYATWQGPRSAAKLAESIRRESEKQSERRRMKLQVFSTLMQERATIASIDSVRMLNSIDFVFADSEKVKEAWADLFGIFHTSEAPHPQLREEKIRVLLREMGADLGLSDSLKVTDIARIYYPNALAQAEELDTLQRQRALLQIRSSGQPENQQLPAPPIDEQLIAKFPPRPTVSE